jgi:hypothetical protein
LSSGGSKGASPREGVGPRADQALHDDAFVVMGVVAMVVYEKLGLMILKRTWFNVDLLWAGALVGASVITLVI